MKIINFLSEQQAITLLEKEFKQGLYNLPDCTQLSPTETHLKKAGVSLPSAISSIELKELMANSIQRNKHKSACAQIPITFIEPKLKMICLLQNLNKKGKHR